MTTQPNQYYYGEGICQVPLRKCTNHYYYESKGLYLCGVHSRNDKKRLDLPVNPMKEKLKKQKLDNLLQLAIEHSNPTKIGSILVRRKMGAWSELPYENGYYIVLPNNKAGTPSIYNNDPIYDLIWKMAELSPMRLGPVKHNQPDLPESKNIENFHQFNKVFPSEVEEKVFLKTEDSEDDNDVLMQYGNPKKIWYDRRLQGYTDSKPHRHKLGNTKKEHLQNSGCEKNSNANICLYSIFVNPVSKKEERYSYLESRVFYCSFYEQLASRTSSFIKLINAVYKEGRNIIIVGPDAREVNLDEDSKMNEDKILDWYLDSTRPFGHEMVLYTMIKLYRTQELYPWRIAQSELLKGFKLTTDY